MQIQINATAAPIRKLIIFHPFFFQPSAFLANAPVGVHQWICQPAFVIIAERHGVLRIIAVYQDFRFTWFHLWVTLCTFLSAFLLCFNISPLPFAHFSICLNLLCMRTSRHGWCNAGCCLFALLQRTATCTSSHRSVAFPVKVHSSSYHPASFIIECSNVSPSWQCPYGEADGVIPHCSFCLSHHLQSLHRITGTASTIGALLMHSYTVLQRKCGCPVTVPAFCNACTSASASINLIVFTIHSCAATWAISVYAKIFNDCMKKSASWTPILFRPRFNACNVIRFWFNAIWLPSPVLDRFYICRWCNIQQP